MEIVKPDGTGSPNLHISERFAPLLPKIFFGLESFFVSLLLKLNTIFLKVPFDQLEGDVADLVIILILNKQHIIIA